MTPLDRLPFSTFSPKPRKPLAPYSQKRRERLPERRATVEATKRRAQGQCEAAELLPDLRCCDWPRDCHEILSRGRAGSPYDPANTMWVCRVHHQHLTEHPAEAEKVGLLLPSQPTKRLLWDRRENQ